MRIFDESLQQKHDTVTVWGYASTSATEFNELYRLFKFVTT